jgi:hypothetical protein
MKYRFWALIAQFLTVIMLFFPIYYMRDEMLSGISFILYFPTSFQEVLAGRIIAAVMALGLIASLITLVLAWIFKENKKIEESSIITFNLTLGVGLVLIVVLGAYMSYLGYIWIGVIIATAYLRSLK